MAGQSSDTLIHPRVYVDERVGSRELDTLLLACGLKVKVRKLRYGDFAFYAPHGGPDGKPAAVGIERKKVLDLVASIETKRLSGSQLPGMLSLYDFTVLIVEGDYVPDFESGRLMVRSQSGRLRGTVWRDQQRDYRMVDSYLNTLRMKTPVHVIKTKTPQETAAEVYMLWHWFTSKSWDRHHSHMEFHQPPPPQYVSFSRPSFFRQVAKEFPNIGWDRSKEVEALFRGSVVDLVNASVEQLARINGITVKRAQDIWRKLRGLREDGTRIWED